MIRKTERFPGRRHPQDGADNHFGKSAHSRRPTGACYYREVSDMSPKELQYIEDALGHEHFLTSQCQQAVSQLTDPELKDCVNQLLAKHRQLFGRFFNLV